MPRVRTLPGAATRANMSDESARRYGTLRFKRECALTPVSDCSTLRPVTEAPGSPGKAIGRTRVPEDAESRVRFAYPGYPGVQ